MSPDAVVELAANESDEASKLSTVEIEALHEASSGAVVQLLLDSHQPASGRGSVDPVQVADLVDAEPIDELMPQHGPLLWFQRVQGKPERLSKLGLVSQSEVLKFRVTGGADDRFQLGVLIAGRLRLAPQHTHGLTHDDDPQPPAEGRSPSELQDPRGGARLRDQQALPDLCQHVVDRGCVGADAGDRRTQRREQVPIECVKGRSRARGTTEHQQDIRGRHRFQGGVPVARRVQTLGERRREGLGVDPDVGPDVHRGRPELAEHRVQPLRIPTRLLFLGPMPKEAGLKRGRGLHSVMVARKLLRER